MAIICPAVLADTPQKFKQDLERATSLTDRIQIDLDDGSFGDSETIDISQVYWGEDIKADLHMMVSQPDKFEHDYISLGAHLVIIHAEAEDGNKTKSELFAELKSVKIKTGLALLPESQPEAYADLIKTVDHVLIFTGHLGHYGGTMDKSQLPKIQQVKQINPGIEIGVDGGINDENAAEVVAAGADVLNIGGFIQKSENPQEAYATIEQIVQRS